MVGKWLHSFDNNQLCQGGTMMPAKESWRNLILKELAPGLSQLTLAVDPDGLLLEEGIAQRLQEQGYELIPFEDPIAFRYAYESRFRARWDQSEKTESFPLLRIESVDVTDLPYDVLQEGHRLRFTLGDIFPGLSYPVLATLEKGDLDALYHAQIEYHPGELGENATREFVLRHVFGTATELIKTPSDLLRILLRRHRQGQRVPPFLDEYLIQSLRKNRWFSEWPLEIIIPDRDAFFSFIQERWPVFLDHLAKEETNEFQEISPARRFEYEGPADLPFEHHDIRVYIDNLFLDGILRPVSHSEAQRLAGSWVTVGLRTDDPAILKLRRLEGLIAALGDSVPSIEARHQDWLLFAHRWGHLAVLWHESGLSHESRQAKELSSLRTRVDESFLDWTRKRYGGLHNQPPVPPVMVHHIPRFLARHLEGSKSRKIALCVLDGLALDQWIVIRDALSDQKPPWKVHENSVFAWLPTLTSVSRQAIFAGKAPLYFSASIYDTDKERRLWAQFWAIQGLNAAEVGYARGLGESASLLPLEETLSNPKLIIMGLVIDKVDKIAHGMQLGTAGMHNQIRQWAKEGFLANLADILFNHGFEIFLTSDHGNIESRGCGRPMEGVLANFRGERVRIYTDRKIMSKAAESFPHAIDWLPAGLPDNFFPLFAPRRSAFVPKGERTVTHGGLSLEELVVPFIRIERGRN